MWIKVDGSPVHVHLKDKRNSLTADEQEALADLVRAARANTPPAPFAKGALELRARLDTLDISLIEARKRWPQWNLGEWSRMLHGMQDPAPALSVVLPREEK